MSANGRLTHLMDEYGNLGQEEEHQENKTRKEEEEPTEDPESLCKEANATLMQAEDRNFGAVTWRTYGKYLQFAGGLWWAPFMFLVLTLAQGAQGKQNISLTQLDRILICTLVGSTLFLGFWTAESIPGFGQGQYMALYAALGISQAILQFILSFSFRSVALYLFQRINNVRLFVCSIAGLIASLNLFQTALRHVLRSPIVFFDTTPMGRILSRLSRDQDILDSQLMLTMMQFLSTFSSVLGTVALVFYTFPLLGIIFAPLMVLYYFTSNYYRRTSVETKRLDSLMRSALYSSYTGKQPHGRFPIHAHAFSLQKLLLAYRLFGPIINR